MSETHYQMLQNGQGRFATAIDELIEKRSHEVLLATRGLIRERHELIARLTAVEVERDALLAWKESAMSDVQKVGELLDLPLLAQIPRP